MADPKQAFKYAKVRRQERQVARARAAAVLPALEGVAAAIPEHAQKFFWKEVRDLTSKKTRYPVPKKWDGGADEDVLIDVILKIAGHQLPARNPEREIEQIVACANDALLALQSMEMTRRIEQSRGRKHESPKS